MKAEITFKSGTTITVDVSRWRNEIRDGELIEFTWTDQRGGRELRFIDPGEVVAVVIDKLDAKTKDH